MRSFVLALAMAAAFGAAASAPAQTPAPRASVLKVSALANGDAELMIYGPIGDDWWNESVTAQSVVTQLAQITAPTIQVRINSDGGSVKDGLAIYNALKRHPARIVVTVDGIAASIASLIAMSGDEVIMPANTLLMIHAPWAYAGGNAIALREAADMLDTYAASMATSYATKTGRPVADMLALLQDGRDHWYTSAQAVESHFADRAEETANTEADNNQAAAAALLSYIGAISRAPTDVLATLKRRVQASVKPAAFASLPEATQRSIVANIEDLAMKQTYTDIMAQANAGGATPPVATATPPAPAVTPAAAVTPVPAPAAAPTVDPMAALQARNASIRGVFAGFRDIAGVQQLEADCLANTGMTLEAAQATLLQRVGGAGEPLNGGGAPRVEAGTDERDRLRTAASNILLARAGVLRGADAAAARQGNPFGNLTLVGMAERMLIRAGIDTRQMTREDIARRALAQSTSDFPNLLENTLHRIVIAGYGATPFTWPRFCATGTLSDYRPHNRYHLSSFSDLKETGEGGEYENGVLGDAAKETITGKRKGRILEVTPEVLMNDDLGGLSRAANALGQAAGRTIEKDAYALLALNAGLGPTMSDGKTLFHADHGNIATAAAPSVDSFDAIRVLLASQMDPASNDYLDITAAIWLGPLALGGTARTINAAEFDVTVSQKFQVPNKVRGMFRDVVDSPRLSGTPWYGFADPNIEPVIEVAFLEGVQQPTLQQETNFRTDGVAWKVVHRYGVGGVGWRGAARNAGA